MYHEVQRARRQEQKNSKHETPNSKQFQMTKYVKFQTSFLRILFWIFPVDLHFSLRLFRILIFGF